LALRKNVANIPILYCVFIVLFLCFLWILYPIKYNSDYYDLVITNAVIHDGNKEGDSYYGGIGINGDKIVNIWKGRLLIKPHAGQVIYANGLDLAPGFIDTHSHADLGISDNVDSPIDARNYVGQGITTIIVGNCGRSKSDISAFAENIENNTCNVNIATLIGYNTIREYIMNNSVKPANKEQVEKMASLIKDGMEDGALGISTGFPYFPGMFASKDEIISQLRLVNKYGGIFTAHIRSEGDSVIYALDEVIEMAEKAKLRLLISHFKITGKGNCMKYQKLKEKIKYSRENNQQIYITYYPYDASSTNLSLFLPKWYLSLNRNEKNTYISNLKKRNYLNKAICSNIKKEGYSDMKFARVAYYPKKTEWQGENLYEITKKEKKSNSISLEDQVNTFIEMEEYGGAQMIYFNICTNVMDSIPRDEECMVGTDSAIRDKSGKSSPHPRGWGAFPKFIRRYVRETHMVSLNEAIYRMSALPAKVYKIENRGMIKKGYYADLVLFDKNSISDRATYDEPLAPPIGIYYVLVNGKIVKSYINDDDFNKNKNIYPGRFLKRGI